MSRLTAMIIQSREVVCSAGGPANNGKYVGWITLREEDRYRPLLNSEAIYNSAEEAKSEMEKVVSQVRYEGECDCSGSANILE